MSPTSPLFFLRVLLMKGKMRVVVVTALLLLSVEGVAGEPVTKTDTNVKIGALRDDRTMVSIMMKLLLQQH